MPSIPPDSTTSDLPALARRIMNEALADVAREARQAGREGLFEAVRPWLGGIDSGAPPSGVSSAEFELALGRLRQRFRERVNRHLRNVEPDAQRRRGLRRALHAACRLPEQPA